MSSPHNLPQEFREKVIIEYDSHPRFKRYIKRMRMFFFDPYKARRFYAAKMKQDRNPKVINPNKETNNAKKSKSH
jgi:hypothetical protein